MPYEYPEPYPRVLVTIDGRQSPAVLRRRTWELDTETWRWDVDVQIDDRRLIRQLGRHEIKLVPRPDERRA